MFKILKHHKNSRDPGTHGARGEEGKDSVKVMSEKCESGNGATYAEDTWATTWHQGVIKGSSRGQ